MKPLHQFVISVVTLAGLLFQVNSNATNLAERPLKASVLAKPNVIFAMDESGSMDAEVMLDGTFQGWFYGNYQSTPLFPGNALRTGSAGNDWNMFYLFPNGTGAGNKVYADPGTNYGYAIPPIPETAFARSNDYNPLYYNSTRTYEPWSPGYIGSAVVTFTNAPPAAAKSHPTLGSTTMNLAVNQASTASDSQFTFTVGMTIPAGTTNLSCYTGGTPGSLPHTVTSSRWMCKGTVSYYPATFWKKQSCTPDAVTCVTAYDGNTIKRYEIKAGVTFPSGRTYADELQNFANWFQYYRKRRLMLGAAMGGVLENISGLNMGVVAFNNNTPPTMYDADASSNSANGLAVAGIFYNAEGNGGTPTHTAYRYIRDQFDTNANIIRYACQKNATFIITDGFANDGTVTPPTYSQSTYGSGTPYQSIAGGSLADQALAYYTLRLRATTSPLTAGRVPSGNPAAANPDTNTNLHLNTYALTLGMKGTLWPARTNAFSSPAPTWPSPVSNTASMIDDLWHATVNGRGQMYQATDVDSTIIGIQSALSDIINQEGAQSSVAVSSFNLLASDGKAYEASYNPAGWMGDLTASAVNLTTGAIANTPTWSASTLLTARDWNTRVIFTSDGLGNGMGFTNANIGTIVNPDPVAYPNSADVVNYLRGRRTGEGTSFRTRISLIGAIINAEPAIDTAGVVYIASSEGMLHAINSSTGAEEWAFVPPGTLPNIGQTVQREYAFKTKLDGTPTVGKYNDTGSKLLVAGMGAAGRSYYALDVTTPTGRSEGQAAAQVKWVFPSTSQSAYAPFVGYTVGRPVIVKTQNDGYVALVTSGYDNGTTIGDGKGRVWMLNANTGAVIRQFTTTAGTTTAEAGLTQVAAYRESDGTSRYVYGGDLLGNLWKFDLNTGTTALVTTLRDASNNPQPITTAPQLSMISNKPLIMVGTGRLLDISDFAASGVQSVYAVVDGATAATRTNMAALTHNTTSREITGVVDWSTRNGWYVDLPAGEQVNVDPKFALGWLYVNANSAGGSDCTQGASGYKIYVRSGAGKSDELSTTANVTSPVLVQVNESSLIRWVRKNDGSIQETNYGLSRPHAPRRNAWRDSR